jgi:anti-sigma B factor antagonist
MVQYKDLFSVERMMGVQVVKILPKQIIDQFQITELGQGLKDLIDQGETKLVLDFSNVEHLSSGTLGVLITTKKLIEAKKGKIKFSGMKSELFEVFRITRLDKVFIFFKNVDDALLSFT